jgi:biopolymer transport protein ExbD
MAIYAPGQRDRHNKPKRGKGRGIVAMLSLTAMVDMFTVLAVFLLQNYNTTGEVIEIDDKVTLPMAQAVKELKPAHVIVVSSREIVLDKEVSVPYETVKAQDDWNIEPLSTKLKQKFAEALEAKSRGMGGLKAAVDSTKPGGSGEDPNDYRRITVQADKQVDFLTIKKVMFTLYEAGAAEINFAVMKDEKKGQ